MMSRSDQKIQELCGIVTGHLWWWNETPILMTFSYLSDSIHRETYERVCRICTKHEQFEIDLR